MRTLKRLHPQNLREQVLAFAASAAQALEDRIGIECRFAEDSFRMEKNVLPDMMHAAIAFHGPAQGEFLLSMDEATASRLVGVAHRDNYEGVIREVLKTSVDRAVENFGNESEELTLLPTRVTYGEVHYANAPIALVLLRLTPGTVECRVALNLMEQKMGQKLQAARSALRTRERDIRQARENLESIMAVLPELNKMVDELFIVQNVIRQSSEDVSVSTGNGSHRHYFAQLFDVSRKIRHLLTRMWAVPLKKTLEKAAFLARKFSDDLRKDVEITIEEEDVEIDRQTDDVISKIMEQIMRNAVEYGIESPETRKEQGKTEFGNIRITGRTESGYVIIEAMDDGRGLNRKLLLNLARHAGMVKDGVSPDDHELNQLIFWSSSDGRVRGSLSGVKILLKQIGGRIVVHSESERGTSFFIRFPMAMSATEGIVVSFNSQDYIIPIRNIRETLRPNREDCFTVKGKGEIVRLRDRLIPLIRLDRVWGTEARDVPPWEALVVVAESGGEYRCILVDQVIGKQNLVVQSLGDSVWVNSECIIGGSIMPNGSVGLVLDVRKLIALTG